MQMIHMSQSTRYEWFLLLSICMLLLLASVSASSSGSLSTTVFGAQTHVVPAAGRLFNQTDALSALNIRLHLVGLRRTLLLFDQPILDGVTTTPTAASVNITLTRSGIMGFPDVTVRSFIAQLQPPSTLPPTEIGSGPIWSSTAWWFNLSAEYVQPGLQVSFSCDAGPCAGLQTPPQPMLVGAPNVMRLFTLPFYLFGINESLWQVSQYGSPDALTQSEYFAKHPLAELRAVNHPAQKITWDRMVIPPGKGTTAYVMRATEDELVAYQLMGAVLDVLNALRAANGEESANTQYYAPLFDANRAGVYKSPGGGLGGGHVGTGDHLYQGVFIHEQGHAYSLPHAGDGWLAGTYPYALGSLNGSAWGWDQNRNWFQPVVIPPSASSYANCQKSYPASRTLTSDGQCVKQDPMQSGSGDQIKGDKYTIFSDFNVASIQKYFEGVTSVSSSGAASYNGGRVFVDPASPTGYMRWNSINQTMVPYTPVSTSGAIYGFNSGFPAVRDRKVHCIIVSTFITTNGDRATAHLTYNQSLVYDSDLTQVFPLVSYVGNIRRWFDPRNSSHMAAITPDSKISPEGYYYCQNSGCDYTWHVTYTDGSELFAVSPQGFRGWISQTLKSGINTNTSRDGYNLWSINVPGDKDIHRIEMLETPQVWKGLPAQPRVVAQHEFKPMIGPGGTGADNSGTSSAPASPSGNTTIGCLGNSNSVNYLGLPCGAAHTSFSLTLLYVFLAFAASYLVQA